MSTVKRVSDTCDLMSSNSERKQLHALQISKYSFKFKHESLQCEYQQEMLTDEINRIKLYCSLWLLQLFTLMRADKMYYVSERMNVGTQPGD